MIGLVIGIVVIEFLVVVFLYVILNIFSGF